MWVVLAVISAVAAGFVSITVKAGMKNVDSNLGTFLRTLVVLVFTFIMAAVAGGLGGIGVLTLTEWAFLAGSGLCTGLSWLCYFKALQIGEVNKVVAVDKLSTVLTMTLAIIILGEPYWWLTFVAMALMLAGTMLMLNKKKPKPAENGIAGGVTAIPAASTAQTAENGVEGEACGVAAQFSGVEAQSSGGVLVHVKKWLVGNMWLPFAVLSLVFASLTSILAKIGMQNINSHLGTFLRTIVVCVMAFAIVLGKRKLPDVGKLTGRNWAFLAVSGVLTGISWLCYYAAIQTGVVSVVAPIDKLSVLISVVFSYLVFKEKLTALAWLGLALLVAGTLLLLV